jgi:twitching motility protein PilT
MTFTHISLAPIDRYLSALVRAQGTDLHITANNHPLMRVDGALQPVPGEPILSEGAATQTILEVLNEELRAELRREKEVDFSFSFHDSHRFRGNCYFQQSSLAMALRAIPLEIPGFDVLGLPAVAEYFANLPQGFVLVTGPTGSGKSTTLAAIIDHINTHRQCHILTIEDPVEYLHVHKHSMVTQREVGIDANSFERALRAALREDPDVILVGEMRDPETIQFALTLAETGHLVFATLHTNDAAQALDRISDVFPAERQAQIRVQLAASIAGVMSQRLLPRTGGGLVAAFEVLVANGAVRNQVRDGKTHQIRNVIASSAREGMMTLEHSLNELLAAGLITYEDAVSRSLYPREIRPAGAAGAGRLHAVR